MGREREGEGEEAMWRNGEGDSPYLRAGGGGGEDYI